VHDGDARPAQGQRRGVDVEVGIVDDDQQMAQRICGPTGEGRTIHEGRSQQRNQLVGFARQVARRANTVELTGNVGVRQPLQPGPVAALRIAAGQRHAEHGRVVPGHRLSDPRAQRRPYLIRLTQHGDPRDFGQVDAGRHVANGALGVEQAA
jgi:hypothetical protein